MHKRQSKHDHITKVMTFISQQMELSDPQLAYIERQMVIAWELGHAEGYNAAQQLHIDHLEAMDADWNTPKFIDRRPQPKATWQYPTK